MQDVEKCSSTSTTVITGTICRLRDLAAPIPARGSAGSKTGLLEGKAGGCHATLELPTDYSRPAIQQVTGGNMHVQYRQRADIARFQALGHHHGVTLYMTLLAAFKVLLYRYSGQEDICVGTPIAGRNHHELEGLIGFFINTLALRSRVTGR